MFWFIKQMFTTLMSFSGTLVTKCMPLNNEPCMIRPTVFALSLVELNRYPFMISLDKCNGSCNAVDDLFIKICVLGEIKDVHVKVFNLITNWNEAKRLINHISCYCKCKFYSTICNSNQKWNNDKGQREFKKYRTCKKIIVRILAHVFESKVSV